MPSGPVLSPPPLPRAASKSATLCTPPCVTPRCLSPPHAPLFITPRCREAEQLLRDQDPSGYDQVGLNPHLTLTPALTLTLTPALTLTLIFTLTLTLALTLTLIFTLSLALALTLTLTLTPTPGLTLTPPLTYDQIFKLMKESKKSKVRLALPLTPTHNLTLSRSFPSP